LNSLNVTVAGVVQKDAVMQRNKAKIGEKVWFIGHSGLSALGLEQWLQGDKHGDFVDFFCYVEPKLKQGLALCDLGVRCCMDVSDGIFQDANHMSKASNIAMLLAVEKLPDWQLLQEKMGAEKAMQVMLSGGEDYGLLFTAPADMEGLDELATCIGVCMKGAGVTVQYQGKDVEMVKSGYDHFAAI